MTKIKVITYNIWHGHRLAKALDFLRHEKPDVLLVQEIGTSGAQFGKLPQLNLIDTFEKNLKMSSFYRATHQFTSPTPWDFGIAIFSKYPLINKKDFFYQGSSINKYKDMGSEEKYYENSSRAVISADVKIKQTLLTVITTHFPWTPDASVSNSQREAAKNLNIYLKELGENAIIGGDFNTPYQSEIYKTLVSNWNEISIPGKPTLHPTHPAAHKNLHVDYLWYRGSAIKHIETSISSSDGSDHLPIVAEFNI